MRSAQSLEFLKITFVQFLEFKLLVVFHECRLPTRRSVILSSVALFFLISRPATTVNEKNGAKGD